MIDSQVDAPCVFSLDYRRKMDKGRSFNPYVRVAAPKSQIRLKCAAGFQSVLFLLKDEGSQGLVHLVSRSTIFHLQFFQRLLTGPKDSLWRPLFRCILQCLNGLGEVFNLLLMNTSKMGASPLPCVYKSAIKV